MKIIGRQFQFIMGKTSNIFRQITFAKHKTNHIKGNDRSSMMLIIILNIEAKHLHISCIPSRPWLVWPELLLLLSTTEAAPKHLQLILVHSKYFYLLNLHNLQYKHQKDFNLIISTFPNQILRPTQIAKFIKFSAKHPKMKSLISKTKKHNT